MAQDLDNKPPILKKEEGGEERNGPYEGSVSDSGGSGPSGKVPSGE